jgi:hypothetical protein
MKYKFNFVMYEGGSMWEKIQGKMRFCIGGESHNQADAEWIVIRT